MTLLEFLEVIGMDEILRICVNGDYFMAWDPQSDIHEELLEYQVLSIYTSMYEFSKDSGLPSRPMIVVELEKVPFWY